MTSPAAAGAARWASAAAMAIVASYACLAFGVLRPNALYSGDIGVKYVQARALAGHHFLSLDIPYPGEPIDPGREFFPIRPPFVLNTGGAVQAIFSPVSATLQAMSVAAGGLAGLVLLSIAGAGIVLYAAPRLVAPELRTPTIVLLGFGSPLWFYAVSGWEHALAVAAGTVGFVCAVSSPLAARGESLSAFDRRCIPAGCVAPPANTPGILGRRALPAGRLACLGATTDFRHGLLAAAPWAAGLFIGAGATLRDEVLLLLPGVLVLLWRRRRAAAPQIAALVAAGAVLVGAAVVEIWWFRRPPAAHVRHAVHLVQSAAHLTSAPNPDVPALEPLTWRERYETVVSYWLTGYGNTVAVSVFAATLAALLIWRRRLSSPANGAAAWFVLGWLVVFSLLAAWDLWGVLAAPRWVAGLFRLSPFLVLALLPGPAGTPGNGLPRAVAITAALYVVVAFIGTDTTGGKALGPRLLLPLLPLLAAAAVVRLSEYRRADGAADRWIGRLGLALAGFAIAMHVGGTLPAYVQRNREDSATLRTIASTPQPYVLADDEFVAQMLLPLYFRKIILLVDTRELGRAIGQRLMEARVPRLILVSRRATPAFSLHPYGLERIEPAGRLVIQYWRRY